MIRRNTAIVFGLFILLLAGTLIWQKSKTSSDGAEATLTTPEDLLLDLDEASLKAITIQDAKNQRVSLQRSDDDKWVIIFPQADATDEVTVKNAVSQFLNVRITSRPQTIPDLETVGLDPATYTILLETKDGKQVLINVGDLTPTESGYYVLTEDRIIYVASKFGLDSLIKFLENPPILVTPTPTVTETPEPTISPGEITPSTDATATP
jgi:hypothetical protein